MGKRIILFGMAIAAVAAFAVPTVAGATMLTEGSIPLEAGATLKAVSHNAKTTNTALGTLACETVTVTAEVTNNINGEVSAKGTGGETTTCKAGSLAMTVTKPTLTTLTTNTAGSDTGTLGLSFIADVGPFECAYSGSGGFSYTTGTDVLNIAGITLSSNEICEPEEGHPTFEGSFTITTSDGTAITVKAGTAQEKWKIAETYAEGDKVEHQAGSGSCYEARETTKGVTPPENLRWKPITC